MNSKEIDEVMRTIGLLFEPGDVFELRALAVGRNATHAGLTYAGYFNFENERAIRAAIEQVDGRSEGVYVVFNPFNKDLLARSANRLQVRPKHLTTDADVVAWKWLYIDIDPIRAAGISATEEEHQAALQKAEIIREFLTGRGWPEPILADSGNGAHLLCRINVTDPKRAGDLVKRCVRALSARFSDTLVKVDEQTATAARLCKLYGTQARKGDSTPDRPHRRSRLIEVPERIEAVPEELLEALAAEAPAAARSAFENKLIPSDTPSLRSTSGYGKIPSTSSKRQNPMRADADGRCPIVRSTLNIRNR